MTAKQRAAIDARKKSLWAAHGNKLKLDRARKNHNNRTYRARRKEAACN